MGFFNFLSRQRDKYSLNLLNHDSYWLLSALMLSVFNNLKDTIHQFAHGKILDAGAGTLNLRSLLESHGTQYVSMDISTIRAKVDIIGDIQNMPHVASNQFDTIFCSEVLEHVPEPWKAISEFHRVLKVGGIVIITVPHLSGLHEEPHDYYRYTPYALNFLLSKNGFEVKEERRIGGLLSFLFHPVSFVVVLSVWSIPGVRWIVWLLNMIFLVYGVTWVERFLGLYRKFPANLLIVGQKI